MKRRLLSAFLAVMMVLTMAPVAFAADTATSDGEALSKLFTDVHAVAGKRNSNWISGT